MPTEKKVQTVVELRDQIARSTIAIGAEYRGLTVAEMVQLRRQMRQAGIELRVVKNTLFRRAAEEAGKPHLAELVQGPTAIVFGYSDVITPARVIAEYIRTARNAFAVRSAFADSQLLTARDIADLASLPPREVLLAQVAGALQAPLYTLAALLSATLREFAGLIQAKANQLDSAAAAAAPAPTVEAPKDDASTEAAAPATESERAEETEAAAAEAEAKVAEAEAEAEPETEATAAEAETQEEPTASEGAEAPPEEQS